MKSDSYSCRVGPSYMADSAWRLGGWCEGRFGLSRDGATGVGRRCVGALNQGFLMLFCVDWSSVNEGLNEGFETGLIAYSKGNVVTPRLGTISVGR